MGGPRRHRRLFKGERFYTNSDAISTVSVQLEWNPNQKPESEISPQNAMGGHLSRRQKAISEPKSSVSATLRHSVKQQAVSAQLYHY